jgi:glycosyltransferase involved in cell wall biosynthesis
MLSRIMPGINILQIFSRYLQPGGEERFAELFSANLSPPHRVKNYFGSTEALRGAGAVDALSMPFRAWHNPRVERELRALHAREKFDLWVIQNTLPGLSPAVYQTAFSLGVPVVHYLHNFRLACANGFFLNHGAPCEQCLHGNFWPAFQTACWRNSRLISGFMGLLIRRTRHLGTFRRVSAWVALNHQQKAKHVQMGIPQDRIHVVPHFFDSPRPPPPSNPSGDVLFLGRLSPEKGLETLLRAWAGVRPGNRKLLIAGRGPEEPSLRALAVLLGLKGVDFLGYQSRENHSALWARSLFTVVPSLWQEPFPLSFLESWAFQRAPVASRLGAMAEYISGELDGILVEPFSVPSLSTAIQTAIDYPEKTAQMGLVGYQKLKSSFTREQWVSRISSVFAAALKI